MCCGKWHKLSRPITVQSNYNNKTEFYSSALGRVTLYKTFQAGLKFWITFFKADLILLSNNIRTKFLFFKKAKYTARLLLTQILHIYLVQLCFASLATSILKQTGRSCVTLFFSLPSACQRAHWACWSCPRESPSQTAGSPCPSERLRLHGWPSQTFLAA